MFQALLLFSEELARLYGDQGIVATAVNPGKYRLWYRQNFIDVWDRKRQVELSAVHETRN